MSMLKYVESKLMKPGNATPMIGMMKKACAYDIQNACGADMRAAGDIGGLVSLMDNLRIEKPVAGDGYRRRSLVFQAIVATDCRTRWLGLDKHDLIRGMEHAAAGGP